MKRNAHACTTIAGGWFVLTLLALWAWCASPRRMDDPLKWIVFGIWGLQLLIIGLAVYCSKTEKPRPVLWFGETTRCASAWIRPADAPLLFRRLAALVPELSDTEIDKLTALAHTSMAEGDVSAAISIAFQGKSQRFKFYFEPIDSDTLEVMVATDMMLADALEEELDAFGSHSPT